MTSKSPSPPSAPKSTIPPTLRLPVLIQLSCSLSAALYTLSSMFGTGELALVSTTRDDWWTIISLIIWRAGELAVEWLAGYDSIDVACLAFLSNLPYQYFLRTFYNIRPTTVGANLLIEVITVSIPFYLLRDTLPVHKSYAAKSEVSNGSIIKDYPIQVYMMILAAAIYGNVIFYSFRLGLPTFFIRHFEEIKSLQAAHNTELPVAIAACILPIGFAIHRFLFTPSLGAKPDQLDDEIANFDPETATFGETLAYNIWGFSKRTRTLIKRTITLALMSFLQTGVKTYIGVKGAEASGGAGWGAVWSIATLLTGAAIWWVGDVNEISN
ncbi:MAG: hypothetical protein LQ342_001183 [Letrouitia transgressa]|nr:MAG: hypothetical protein LQ342_001183 [Letrouitia transgressa]